MKPRLRHERALLEDLEPRILFSADHPAALVGVTLQDPHAPAAGLAEAVHTQPMQQQPVVQQTARELVFIDSRLPDAQGLADDIAAQAASGRAIEAVLLDADSDGIAQIGTALAGRSGLTAVHLVAHGADASLTVGNSTLDSDALLMRAADIAGWGAHLSADADLLIYGCDFAADSEGQALVQNLAQLTGADVAASTDRTGAARLGGDWVLEDSTGQVEAASALSASAQSTFDAVLATYTVTNTNDSGAGSLRQAIIDANANVGADTINFAIAGSGVHTIALSTALPSITGTVIIDATTDDSFAANGSKPAIILDGGNGYFNGLVLGSGADGSTVRGLVVRDFQGDGIQIATGSDGNTIAGNYLGAMTASGTAGGSGGNDNSGIYVLGANNVIGGSTAADRNVIAGNGFGVEIAGAAATGNQVIGNYIGIDATGMATLGNTERGVMVLSGATGNTVGGSSTSQRNLIAGNGEDAINIDGEASDGNAVRGNWIGIAADGATLLRNGSDGIFIANGADNTQVGGSGANDGNWVAGVTFVGVEIDGASTGTLVQGNRIGTDLAGTANWGAGETGVLIENQSVGGGPSTNRVIGNTIAFSGQSNLAGLTSGIRLSNAAGTGNQLSANSIYSSVGIGIDLQADGVTPNDTGDGDTGANNLQNFPVLTSAKTDASSQLTVGGTLNSTAGSYFRIEFFASPSADATGYGEGKVYLGFANVATNGSGTATISATLSGVNVPVGYVISATATASNSGFTTFTDTSEFGKSVVTIATTQATIIVDTASDTIDGDTTSLSTLLASKGADGKVSLREAITAANNTANGSQVDLIRFGIAASGVQTITLASALPSITDAVKIDGTTEAGYTGSPLIALNGAGSSSALLTLAAGSSGSTVRGLDLQNFAGYGLYINGSSGNTVAGNYLGIDATGNAASGTSTNPITIYYGSNNVIGGSTAADRNVIAGNYYSGVLVTGTSTGNLVQGNYFGINAAGTAIVGAATIQVEMNAPGNTLGGASAGQGNVIAGQINGVGVYVQLWAPATGTTVQGNLIGLNAAGTAALTQGSNTPNGIYVRSSNNIIGGTTAGARNVIGGVAGYGIDIDNAGSGGANNTVQGNYIGTDITGTALVANGRGGVRVQNGAANNTIGGTAAGAGNLITGNSGTGVYVTNTAGTGNAILGNSINGNSGLGINLQGGTEDSHGVTANDAGDADTGANNLQNTPVLTLAKTNGSSQVNLSGTLNSTAGSYFRIEFFASASANSSGYGDGQTLIGFVDVATDAFGNASFSAILSASVPAGYVVTATATRSNAGYSAYTDTSEFSAALAAGTAPVNTVPGAKTVAEDTPGAITGLSVVDGGVLAMTTSLSVLNGTLTVSLAGGATISSGSNSSAALTLSGSTAQVNAALATLSYLGGANYDGSDTLTMLSTDASALSDSDTVAITVTAVNDAPVLSAFAPTLTTITEDQTANAGQTVASFIGASITDVDSGAVQGIAITSLTSGTGTWQYSTNAGSSWTAVGAVSGNSALLLRSTDYLRFVPNGQNATSGSVTYRGWDRTSGSTGNKVDASTNGTTTAFSTSTDTASITVTAINDAPVLGAIAPTLTTINEDATNNSGQTVASFVGASITDVDSGAVQGIAVTGLVSGNGTWQYSTDGASTWTAIGAVSGSSALLLRSNDYLRFVPDGQNATTGSVTYRAWDQTSGSTGSKVDASTSGTTTAFSASTDSASITVTALNDAPVLGAVAPALTTINEDATTNSGQTVASFVGASITDVDTGAVQGIAITGLVSNTGLWQYSINGGSSWTAVGTVNGSSALLLRSTDYLRFVPDGLNATTGSVAYRAWDQTSGSFGSKVDASTNGSTTAFSTASDTASITVTAVNDAPVLTAIAPTLTTINEDATNNSGQTVASMIGGSITDVDSVAVQGIAITGLTSGNGTWQFSTDSGTSWNNVGTVGASSALLLRASDSIRLVPNGQNATTGSITYRAWDQSAGSFGNEVDASTNGGTTAFSTASDTASITVTAVNDAPVLTPGLPTLSTITEDQTANAGQTVASILGASITDVDSGAVQGIAIAGLVSNTGTWQFSTDGGSTWSNVGAVSGSSALLLRSNDSIRFVPDGQNATTGSITYQAWDQTSATAGSIVDASTSGGTTAFSMASDTASITVTAVNDAPVLTPAAPTLTSITEDQISGTGQTVASFLGASITDVDISAVQGIALSALVSNTGSWQYSTDGGSTWSAVGTVSASSALLLRSTDSIRFVPDGQNGTTGTLTYRAWDQTSGSAGSKVDASTNGGTTAFSTASDTASINVTAANDAPVLTPASPALTPITEDQTANTGQTIASFLGASITDVDSGAVQGIAITSLTSGTGTWQFSTDGGSTWSAVGTVSASSALLLRSTDSIRFVPDGQNGTIGSLTYRAWDQTSGGAGSKVDGSTNGGTTAFSAATDTASITVTAVNDAPVLTPASPALTTITEDQTANAGQTVASFLGASITDVDSGAVQGIAITSLTSGTGTWQFSIDGGSTWSAVGTVSASSALLLRSTDSIRFVPNGQNATTGSITYRAWDQTSGSAGGKIDASTNGGTTAFSTATDTASITVTALNDAPVLTPAAQALTTITEDQTANAGQTVASFLGASITDVDSGAVQGIAITSLTSGTGTWQYSTDGGSTWSAVGTVSASSALLLRSTDSIRFVPDGQNGTIGSLTYRAWDQTSGGAGSKVDGSTNGGTTAFSTATDTASITVTAVNDAPVLTPGAPVLTTITEDQTANAGQTVASFLGASITDIDSGAVQGIAITSLSSGTGTWQYSTDGGSTWSAVGTVSASSALLLRSTDSLRFVPDGQNGTTGSITYCAWDQTSGSAGGKIDASTNGGTTAFSTATDTASITVTALNDAPVLTPAAPTLTTITEDQTVTAGQTVASFLGASITDVDSGAVQGIAITSLSSGTGTWQYSTDGGSSWANVGTVSASSALLLRSTDSVRFVPNGQNATTGSISYQAWDQTSGSAGSKVDASTNGSTTAFSTASDTAAIILTAVNDAPVLTAIAPTLTTINEDQTANTGQTVASFLGGSITDVDSGAVQGIAITSLTSGTGAWQYSTDGGSTWSAVGTVSASSALLLRSTDSLRFVPDGQNGTTGSITYRAWDQTSGSAGGKIDASTNGGTTAFSTATDTASITVTALNDAPVLTPAAQALTTITEDQTANAGQTVASFLGASITDVDSGAVQGIAITSLSSGTGAWQYSTDGGSSWANVGTVSASSALLLRSTDSVRFVPNGQNATTGSITYQAWDQTSGSAGSTVDASTNGGTTAFSTSTDAASITVTAVDDAPVLGAIAPTFTTITEDQTANAGQTVASFLGASISDVDSGAVQGIAITSLSSGTGTWHYSTDGGSTWSAVGTVSASSALLLRSTDSIRFVPDGQNGTTGTLTYRAWDQTSGSAGSKVDASTNGGTTAFSTATDTASITVTALNDAPVLTPAAQALTTITEDQTANAGQTVASFLGGSITDGDSGAVQGIAITSLTSGTGTWQFSIDGGSTWSAVGTVSASSALLLRSTDSLRFVPDSQNGTTGSITYRAWDQTSGSAGGKIDASTNGGTTAFSTATDTASITVTALNDAPVLTPAAPTLTTITEDQTANTGQTVASFLGASITDVDSGAVQGIAITSLSSGTGTWQYSTDGGSSWANVGTVSASSALLLRSTDSVRFVPSGQNATTGSITYQAWDQTSGSAGGKVDASTNGGTTAFSTATDTASINVTAVNDAPVLTPAAPALTTITEDQTANAGQTVASFLGASITDVDSGAVQGIAITSLSSGTGTWQFSTDGGSTWSAVGTVSASSALLLRSTDSVRFVPNGQNATTGSITYQAWDQTSGSAGGKVDASTNGGTTAFSTATDTASITVTAVNDAPVLTPAAPALTTITEDQTANAGQTVASFLGASITDVDSGAVQGIAITSLTSGTGTWQFSIDGGSTWSAVGTVSASSALLLRSTDSIRFVPNGQNATTGSITYRAWDQTSGSAGGKIDASTNGGTTAFSTATDTASITVTALNDAPVLTPAAPTLTTITEDQTANTGQTVASFLGASITDVDSGAVQGIAITSLSSGTGTWQYSTDGGSSWANVGTVSASSALLLRSTDSVRFVPNGQNATTGSITHQAWDQTIGSAGGKVDASTNGGTTAFSTATDTASINVTAVNDAPVLTPAAPALTTITEDQTANAGQTVASFLGASITDVDSGAVQGIAITSLSSGTGTWQFSTDGGSTWSAVGTVSASSALLLRSTDSVRFVPSGQNATTGSITHQAWDQTIGSAGGKVDASTNGGTTAFSTATDTASINVTAVNDAPVLAPAAPALTTITEDQAANAGQTVASFLGASITDVDSGALQGIAITSLTSGTGTWQFSIDGGSTWSAVGTVSASSALMLRSTDSIRFVPDGQNGTTGSLSYRAWDQTSGSAGGKVDANTNGGTTPFSTATDTASVTVTAANDAPVLTPASPALTPITEDQTATAGQTVASFLGASISDVDSGAVQGIAITGLDSNTGTWQFSTDGGSTWSAVGTVSASSALLLRSTDSIRFVPNGQNATTGSITYQAWDQTSGSAGSKVDASTNGGATAFSTVSDTASITVTAVNDAPVLTPAAQALTTITEDQAANAGQTVASFLGASITDVDSGALQGIAITSLTSGTGAWQFLIDGRSTWSAVGTVSASSALLLRSTDSIRFVPDGQNGTTGTLTYRAWDQTSGSAGGKVDASTNGGTTAFSTATDTASITVTALNDAPVLTPAAPAPTTITEDQTANAGQTIASFLGASISDVDSGAVQGIAITSLTSGTGTWQFSTDGGSTWSAVGTVSASSTLLLRSTDSLRLVPDGQNGTTGSITYRAWDQTSGSAGSRVDASTNGTTTAFSTASDTAAITVTAVNDAPVLGAIAPTLTTVTEDQTANAGQTVGSFLGASITDVDSGAVQGIAITGLVSGNGTWQFSTNGGSSWTAVGTVSGSSALLLRSTDCVRFVPDGQNATTGSLTYRAWDQTSGSAGSKVDASTNGSTTAFSTASDTAAITVTAVNDAPVLTAIAPTLTTITEDQTTNAGHTVASFIGTSIADVDSVGVQGIAITSISSGTGTWQYSTDGGSSWANVGTVSASSALLLRSTDSIRFVPNGQNATTGSITYQAWDQTSGSASSKVDGSTNGGTTAFSTATDTASITVTALDDAPVLTPASPALTPITEDQTANTGQTVASFLGVSISDVDSGAVQGIAITGLDSSTGTWQFSTDGGSTWSAVGTVSASSALLLHSTDSIRFVPDGQNGTTGSLSYRAWDQTSGSAGGKVDANTNGGTTPFSTVTDTASITVTAANDAPVLTPASPALTPITEDQTANAGQTVASFLGASISDVDIGAVQGIAITGLDSNTGTWQFSTDGGSTWSAVGTVSASSALLLRPTDSIRFVPNGQNATTGSITYQAWDQTSGSAGGKVDASTNGGNTAFSTSTDAASITVTAVNDAPVLGAIAPTFTTITEDQTDNAGQTVASLLGASITDVDSGAVQGIAITSLTSGTGAWQYSTDGGSTWSAVGTVSASSALLLRSTDSIRFVPDGQNGTTGSLTYRAWDQTSGSAGGKVDASTNGGTTAFSTTTHTASITVTAVNDAPVLTPAAPTLTTITEDQTTNAGQTVASFLGASITDVDNGAVQGLAITALSAGNGSWQFSTDGGTSWAAVGAVGNSSALLLRATDRVRFVPEGPSGTLATISYRAWDQSSGSAGGQADTSAAASAGGLSGAFSAASDTAAIVVTALEVVDPPPDNQAPTITSHGGGSTAAVSVNENDAAVARVEAGDADLPAQTLRFAIVGGADAARFTIDAATGELRFVEAPDFELPRDTDADNRYELVVQASDGALDARQALTVTVLNANDNAPRINSDGGGSSASLAVADGRTTITQITASDADALPGAMVFAVVGGADAARFAVDAATGELRLLQPPHFDTAGEFQRFEVIVGVSDGTLSSQQTLNIRVTDNSTPTPPPAPPTPPTPPSTPPSPPPPTPQAPPAPATRPEVSEPAVVDRPAQARPAPFTAVVAPLTTLPAGTARREIGEMPVTSVRLELARAGSAYTQPAIAPIGPTAWRDTGGFQVPRALTIEAFLGAVHASESGERAAEDLQTSMPEDAEADPEVMGTAIVVGGGLAATAGMVLWASRAAAVLASLLVSAPAWRGYDLLPVLCREKKSRRTDFALTEPMPDIDAEADEDERDRSDDSHAVLQQPANETTPLPANPSASPQNTPWTSCTP